MRIGQASVKLQRMENGKVGFWVGVHSKLKPKVKANHMVIPKSNDNVDRIKKRITLVVDMAVEYLGEKYGDNIDPDITIRDAIAAFLEECADIKQRNEGMEKKIKRLKFFSHFLDGKAAEIVKKLYRIKDSSTFTAAEVEWVDLTLERLKTMGKI